MALVGYFNTMEEAIRARDCAAMVVPSAILNNPASSYTMGQVLVVVSEHVGPLLLRPHCRLFSVLLQAVSVLIGKELPVQVKQGSCAAA
jgi:hypothetical protein